MLSRSRSELEDERKESKLFDGPVEVDETYMGGKRRNMSNSKRKELTGRDPVGKTTLIGMRNRDTNKVTAEVVSDTTSGMLQGFVKRQVVPAMTIYTDESTACANLPNQDAVDHSVSEYSRGRVHINGIESFWLTLKRAHKGAFHLLSPSTCIGTWTTPPVGTTSTISIRWSRWPQLLPAW